MQIFVVAVALIAYILWSAYRLRIRADRYECVGETPTTLMLATAMGSFRFDKAREQLQIKDPDEGWVSVEFSEIAGVELNREDSYGSFPDVAAGWGDWECLRRPGDIHVCEYIDIKLVDNGAVRFFVAYQYQENDAMFSRCAIKRACLRTIGLHRDAASRAQEVYDDLVAHLSSLELPRESAVMAARQPIFAG